MNEKYIVKTIPGYAPEAAQLLMNQMDQQGYRVLAVSHGHVQCGAISILYHSQ